MFIIVVRLAGGFGGVALIFWGNGGEMLHKFFGH